MLKEEMRGKGGSEHTIGNIRILMLLVIPICLIPLSAFATGDSTSSRSNDGSWSKGDILISSSTIFAFFGFGSFFLFRIQNKEFLDNLLGLLGGILICVFSIECCQMYVILSVITDQFSSSYYFWVMVGSIVLFGLILAFSFVIVYFESTSIDVARSAENNLEKGAKGYNRDAV